MSSVARALGLAAALAAAACAGGRAGPPASALPAGTSDDAAREVFGRFVRALDAGRFEEAHALLSSRWRAAYTPARLALDFRGAGPVAREAAARVTAGLAGRDPLERSEAGARLPFAGGRAATLVAEAGSWRVDALE